MKRFPLWLLAAAAGAGLAAGAEGPRPKNPLKLPPVGRLPALASDTYGEDQKLRTHLELDSAQQIGETRMKIQRPRFYIMSDVPAADIPDAVRKAQVSITGPDALLDLTQGEGGELEVRAVQTILRNPQLRLRSAVSTGRGAITITARRLKVNVQHLLMTFEEDVFLEQEGNVMSCDRLQIVWDDAKKQPQRGLAYGAPVHFHGLEGVLETPRLELDFMAGTVACRGGVQMRKDAARRPLKRK